MFSRFTRAIVRAPAPNFADGLTSVSLGSPDVPRALAQHEAYCAALERAGLELIRLPADPRFPDSTFVEDTALIIPGRNAMLTRPGAASREGEVAAIAPTVRASFPEAASIAAPGTLDAGDVCEAEGVVFIGVSARTNEAGAAQLGEWLRTLGVPSRVVDIRSTPGILHLKSGVVALRGRRLLAIDALATHPAFAGFEVFRVPADEAYAANCVQVNEVVLVAAGFPRTHDLLRHSGYTLDVLEMTEFEKMDGGLSCLSLRF
jgi:dimethylargininase